MLLPNGKVLVTSSGVINTTYNGYGGSITYYVPKTTSIANIGSGGTLGNIVYNGTSRFECWALTVPHLISVSAKDAERVYCYNDTHLSNLIAEKATIVVTTNCAITAKSIGDILYAAYTDNRENVVFDFSGGANALLSDIEIYWATLPGMGGIMDAESAIGIMQTERGGTFTINGL